VTTLERLGDGVAGPFQGGRPTPAYLASSPPFQTRHDLAKPALAFGDLAEQRFGLGHEQVFVERHDDRALAAIDLSLRAVGSHGREPVRGEGGELAIGDSQ